MVITELVYTNENGQVQITDLVWSIMACLAVLWLVRRIGRTTFNRFHMDRQIFILDLINLAVVSALVSLLATTPLVDSIMDVLRPEIAESDQVIALYGLTLVLLFVGFAYCKNDTSVFLLYAFGFLMLYAAVMVPDIARGLNWLVEVPIMTIFNWLIGGIAEVLSWRVGVSLET